MDTELLFGAAVILLAYAAAALAYRRWMRARLSRRVSNVLSALWLSQLLLFALHVVISEGRFRGVVVDSFRAVADWSLYSEGLDSVPTVYASLQLALTAGVALWLGLRLSGKGRESAYWLAAGAGLTFLALDELISIHNSALLKLYLAGGALWFLVMARELWREQDAQARWNRTWVLGGMVLAVVGGIILDRFSGNSICVQVDLVIAACWLR